MFYGSNLDTGHISGLPLPPPWLPSSEAPKASPQFFEHAAPAPSRETAPQTMQLHPSLSPLEADDPANSSPEITLQSSYEQLHTAVHTLQQNAEYPLNLHYKLQALQRCLADLVLRNGAATAAQSINAAPEDTLLATVSIKLLADLIDLCSGIPGVFYQKIALKRAEQKVAELKQQGYALAPYEQSQLQELEKEIKYLLASLPQHLIEQSLRTSRIAASYTTFTLSLTQQVSWISSWALGMNSMISGINTALCGLLFYQARQQLQTVENWSQDFKTWAAASIPSVTGQMGAFAINPNNARERFSRLIAIRRNRRQAYIQRIKRQDPAQVKAKVKKVKVADWLHWTKGLTQPEKMDLAAWSQKLGLALTPADLQAICSACREGKTADLETLLGTYADQWVNQQTPEALIAYHVEHQAILAPLIKNAVIGMVQKKQQMDTRILRVHQHQAAIRLTVSTATCAVITTLAIMALLSNPVSAAALVLTLLTVSSIVLSLGLLGGGYYFAERQTRGLSPLAFHKASIQLSTYHLLAATSAFKEKTQAYWIRACREKRDWIDQRIRQLPLHIFMPLSLKLLPAIHHLSKKKGRKVDASAVQRAAAVHTTYKRSEYWLAQASALQERLEEIAWQDFARRAHLSSSDGSNQVAAFSPLEALNEAVNELDFDLMSDDTSKLFEQQLGIHIPTLQKQLTENPGAFKRFLRDFFNQDPAAYTKFIQKQQAI